jgi:hypothetical protein
MNRMRTRSLFSSLCVITAVVAVATGAQASGRGSAAGSIWSIVPSPNRGSDFNRLNAVSAASASDVWAVGLARRAPSAQYRTLIERFDGTAWHLAASPSVGSSTNELNAVDAESSNDVWAVGQEFSGAADRTLALHFDGTTWAVVPTPNVGPGTNRLTGVAARSPTDVWAVGSSVNPVPAPLAMHFDGTSWTVVPAPDPVGGGFFTAVAAVSADDVWAVGGVGDDGDASLAEHWNGTAWKIVPTPPSIFEDSLTSVVAGSSNDVWAVGNKGSSTLTEHWNGTAWSMVSSPNPLPTSKGNNFLTAVVELSPTDVWAIGATLDFTLGELERTMTMRFDGSAWHVVRSPNLGTGSDLLLGATSPGPGQVTAVGSFRPTFGGIDRTLAMATVQG